MDFAAIANIIGKKNGTIPIEIDITVANSYRGDMEGLLLKHLKIKYPFVPYIITANGFNSGTDYNGETKILILSDVMMTSYLEDS